MREELKPCPFCGSDARLESAVRYVRGKHEIRGLYWHVGCSDPDCILYLDKGFKQARLLFATRNRDLVIRRWNRRPNDDLIVSPLLKEGRKCEK